MARRRLSIGYAVVLALAAFPASAEPVILSCHAAIGAVSREWSIRIDGDSAIPAGPSYERLLHSAHPAQYIASQVTAAAIDIQVRDGNAGQEFTIDRGTGALRFERMSDLNHSGTERVVEAASGVCR